MKATTPFGSLPRRPARLRALQLLALPLFVLSTSCLVPAEQKPKKAEGNDDSESESENPTETQPNPSVGANTNLQPSGDSAGGVGTMTNPGHPGDSKDPNKPNEDNSEPKEGDQESAGDDTASKSDDSAKDATNSTAEDEPGTSGPKPDCKEDDEEPCQELADGTPIQFPDGKIMGSCKAGIKTCKDGKWSTCLGAVAPKPMDTCDPGNDDNCNGISNDHCTCTAGTTQECGSNLGACRKGKQTCQADGSWSMECVGEIRPSPERCDGRGIDEDCNGKADKKDPVCDCVPGEYLPCGSSMGECRPGKYQCEGNGKFSTFCQGEIKPRPERCDGRGKDEDCNGKADKDDPACECNPGELEKCRLPGLNDCALGYRECSIDGKWSSCMPRFRSPGTEICGVQKDGRESMLGAATGDEDCDGDIDESDASNPSPRGCVDYVYDADGDGYSAPGNTACYCAGKQPAKWIEKRSDNEGTDCCDDPNQNGKRINPDVTRHSSEPSSCLSNWKGGPYDYNCNGKAEHYYEKTKSFDCGEPGYFPHPGPEKWGDITTFSCKSTHGKIVNEPGKCGDKAESFRCRLNGKEGDPDVSCSRIKGEEIKLSCL